jgi:TonB-linked SusC/RagA family outer membrane protein
MRTKFNVFLTLLLALVVQVTFAQEKVITGVVTEEGTGEPIPGANVVIKGTNVGAATDFDGKFTIKAKEGDVLVFSVVGYQPVEKKVGASNKMNVALKSGDVLEAVVITGAQGIKEKPKEVSYAQQVVKEKDLTIGKDNNIKTALAGKVAGVQVHAQAGSKLGQTGKVYLRGAISALGREEALYIVDGVETSPENVDMDNVASINVLKGPSAVSLYGLRGAGGVIIITTKEGKKGQLNLEVYNTTTFDKVSYLPNYQNEYGQGYRGDAEWATYDQTLASNYHAEWAALDGVRYIKRPYADESWGPKFDGQDYAPWYVWWPGENNSNPYYGKPQKYEAAPDNVKNFYNTGVNSKSGFALSGGTEKATGRVSFSTNNVSGLIPTTGLKNNIFSGKFKINVTDKFTVGLNAIFSNKSVEGGTDFDDSYGNAISGSFNQWFGRQLRTDRMKELKNLKTVDGYTASWNWWSPYGYLLADLGYIPNLPHVEKPVFWFNPYWQLDQESYTRDYNRYVGKVDLEYKVSDDLKFTASAARTSTSYQYNRKTNYLMQYNSNADSFGYTDYLNSMTDRKNFYNLNEATVLGDYKIDVNEDVKVGVILGFNTRIGENNSLTSAMSRTGQPDTKGFVIPDVYNFANSKEIIKPVKSHWEYKTYNVFSRFKASFKDYLFFTGDLSNVWDSRYDLIGRDNDNSFMFGSAGLSFVFSDAFQDLPEFINHGKLRVNYAQVGTEIAANALNPGYIISSSSYGNLPLMFTPEVIVDPNVKPATSSAFEVGLDTRMFDNRMGFSITYFNEHRKDEIIRTEIPHSTGARFLMANAGDVQRTGFELEIGGTPVKTEDFKWDISFNFSNPYVKVLELAPGQDSQLLARSSFGVVSVVNIPGEEYGQIQGTAIKKDANGNNIIDPATGLYVQEQNHNFGSILPDFNGGLVNKFSYKGFDLAATISYQKGGKFFSLTEWWGRYTGILEETAGLNDKGNPKRDDVANGGGVHVVGVDPSGNTFDDYIPAKSYFQQQYPTLAETFVHDADYIKLSEVSLTYSFPKKMLGKRIKAAKIGVVVRNVGLLAVAKDNKHNWDPSEFGYMFGDDAQLPGTRSYGFNVYLSL